MYPTEKGAAPYRYYVLDCFVGLSPAAPNGGTAVVIAADIFTKWPEYCILAHLDSYHVAAFIHEYIVCRYGVPTRLREDRGSEFKGEVIRYCKSMGIALTTIATQNPRANGMAERMVATIKSGIRRCMTACPE